MKKTFAARKRRSIRTKRLVKSALMVMLSILCLLMTGCAALESGLHDMHGSIEGNAYTIDTFDNFGKRVMKVKGRRIDVNPNVVEEYSYSSDGWIRTKTFSSVITITVDGKQLISCGDTCVFYEDGLKPDYEFYPNEIESDGEGGLAETTLISGLVNEVRNQFGKPMVVLIKSQTGAPIYAFSGNEVRWEVPKDLPKFTKLMIDGKALYIHRANFQIVDKELL